MKEILRAIYTVGEVDMCAKATKNEKECGAQRENEIKTNKESS